MGEFADSVRRGQTKGPQQRGFTITDWRNAFDRLREDEEDVELHASGLWFARDFESIRAITNEAFPDFRWATVRERLLSFVGYSVREWTELGLQINAHVESLPSKEVFVSELERIPVKSPFMTEADPVGVIEILVDGLRYPLSLRHSDNPTDIPAGAGGLSDLKTFQRLTFSGQHYHTMEQCWLDCVWNGYRVTQGDKRTDIVPRDEPLSRRQAVAEFRRYSLAFEGTQRAAQMWLHDFSEHAREMYLRRRRIFRVFKRHGRFRVKVGTPNFLVDDPSSFPLLRTMLTPEFVDPVMNRRSKQFRDLTLAQVIDAYDLVAQIPRELGRFLPQDSTIMRPEDLLEWAPVFSKSELMTAFESALGIGEAQSLWLVELMTYSLNVREQLWFTPFVPVAHDELALVVPAVSGVHYPRLLDWLLGQRPDLEGDLGTLFEIDQHEKLVEAVETSRLRRISSVCRQRSVNFEVRGASEEIDLAFTVGHHLFVCELKAGQFTTEPLEHLHYRAKLDGATEQALRKAHFVRDHLEAFVAETQLKPRGGPPEIHPLVVSSSSLFAGWKWNGVSVVDPLILRLFFTVGELEMLGYHDQHGELISTATITFYTSPADAIQTISKYFSHAPQVRIFEPYATPHDSPLPRFTSSEPPKFFRSFVIQLPHELIREHLARAKSEAAQTSGPIV